MTAPTLRESLATLRALAAAVEEDDPRTGARRLLERVAAREDAPELRSALVELGAVALIDPIGALDDFGDDEG